MARFDHGQRVRMPVWCTGVQHGSTLVAALGAFLLLFGLNTEPVPEALMSLGVIVMITGICGIATGWLAKRIIAARARQSTKLP